MANFNTPVGLEPYGQLVRIRQYEAGSVCNPGDAVALASDGQVDPADSASSVLLGVCLSYASAAGVKIMVADHPDQQFLIQANSSAVDTQTDIGLLANIIQGTASTQYKTSRQQLDVSTLATTASTAPQLQILGIEPKTNNAFGAQAKCIVRINGHQLAQRVAGV